MFARVPNLYRELAAKDATRCIRVQDLDRVLASYLPNKDAVALGIEWQHGWYLPHESLVLVVAEPRSLDRQRLWWVRLALFLRQDFITPHCTAYFVQRPQRVVQANTRFVNGLAFEQVLRVVHLLHETIKDYPDLEMDSWFYAAVLFELITDIEEPSKVTPIKWKDKTRLTHQNHPTANRIQREQYQELSNRVRQVLNLESTNRPHHVDDRIGRYDCETVMDDPILSDQVIL
ncbi:hypothetical protein FRC09_020669 [Ceratobasidium sp. 395]|nr:hypothetical protein FRC09_020669 [Ceratobasidium sp. 395]